MKIHHSRILVTGASFIGVHLIESLINKGAKSIKVINLTDRHFRNLQHLKKDVNLQTGDLRDINTAKKAVTNIDIVFHLACDHGGRGYVELRQGQTATNFLLDGSVFKACLEKGVDKVFFASSGCVYPNFLQKNSKKTIYLKEGDVVPPHDADNVYGWAKLMGEITLQQYYKSYGLKSVIGRLFTVYGPYASESHAVMATIAKTFIKQDPFEIWGNGEQIRNWTFVEDIVNGILLLVDQLDRPTPINLGTSESIKALEMVKLVHRYMNHNPKIIKSLKMPVGPKNRVASNSLAKKLIGWSPQYKFNEGLKKTIDWYIKNKNPKFIARNLNKLLI